MNTNSNDDELRAVLDAMRETRLALRAVTDSVVLVAVERAEFATAAAAPTCTPTTRPGRCRRGR